MVRDQSDTATFGKACRRSCTKVDLQFAPIAVTTRVPSGSPLECDTMQSLQDVLQEYKRLIEHLKERFRFIREKYKEQLTCGRGCALCCHGLFDISVPDALRVAEGFRGLPEEVRTTAAERAAAIQSRLNCIKPGLKPPYYLDAFSPEEIDALVAAAGEVRCPFLDQKDSCLIYEYRPIACLLEGVPMVDAQDGLFGDWCELNFKKGIPEGSEKDLCLDYYGIAEIEQNTTIFIPSVIVVSNNELAADQPGNAPGK